MLHLSTISQARRCCKDIWRCQICCRQPKVQWHKTFDINYPTAVDKARLRLLAQGQDIGDEIQIHGGGIDDNWTWGCIGMRNADTVVWIVGKQLTYEDLECDEAAGFLTTCCGNM